jgi:energy-coupling factor transport system ATP-binding protein
VIHVEDVTVQRPGRAAPVLQQVSFALAPGERAALLGGNGSGKTTLGRLLNGTLLPTHGRVLVAGHDTRDPQTRVAVRRAVGLLFQDPDDQFVTTSAEREIAFGLENLCVPRGAMQHAVSSALRDFGLEAYRHTPPHALSGGEKARLALACVWVMQPQALVLDETASLLDRRGRENLAALLAALPATTTQLHLTTDADVAAAADRILVLHAGRLIADGPPDAVCARLPREVVVRTGLPLVWRVSTSLVARGRITTPTATPSTLVAALRPAARHQAATATAVHATPAAAPAAPARAPDFLLRARDVHYRYESFLPGRRAATGSSGAQHDRTSPTDTSGDALRGISLTVQAGDGVALLGASGVGKTTLLHVLAGLLRPQRGTLAWSASWDGVPSLVLQFAERQLFAPTVREDVAYGLRESGVPRHEVAGRVDAALDDVGLPPGEFAARVPFHLSGGEMRRVALAGALAQARPVLLLDEPTLGLDAEGRARLAALVARVRARGQACWLASHAADFVAETCSAVHVLAAGEVAFAGAPAALWRDAARALALGVEQPRAALLAGQLAEAGLGSLAELMDEEALVAALEALATPGSA